MHVIVLNLYICVFWSVRCFNYLTSQTSATWLTMEQLSNLIKQVASSRTRILIKQIKVHLHDIIIVLSRTCIVIQSYIKMLLMQVHRKRAITSVMCRYSMGEPLKRFRWMHSKPVYVLRFMPQASSLLLRLRLSCETGLWKKI